MGTVHSPLSPSGGVGPEISQLKDIQEVANAKSAKMKLKELMCFKQYLATDVSNSISTSNRCLRKNPLLRPCLKFRAWKAL